MNKNYSVRNNEVIFFSEEEEQELISRRNWELSVNLPIQVRNMRNGKLIETDWTQAADVPQAIKDKYATYRQALRDVPQQSGFPQNIVWPVEP